VPTLSRLLVLPLLLLAVDAAAADPHSYANTDAVTVRAVAFTDRDPDGLVRSIRLHGDTTEVFTARPNEQPSR